jgi:hypothetical protein
MKYQIGELTVPFTANPTNGAEAYESIGPEVFEHS